MIDLPQRFAMGKPRMLRDGTSGWIPPKPGQVDPKAGGRIEMHGPRGGSLHRTMRTRGGGCTARLTAEAEGGGGTGAAIKAE